VRLRPGIDQAPVGTPISTFHVVPSKMPGTPAQGRPPYWRPTITVEYSDNPNVPESLPFSSTNKQRYALLNKNNLNNTKLFLFHVSVNVFCFEIICQTKLQETTQNIRNNSQ
jgi:hypothetical protein